MPSESAGELLAGPRREGRSAVLIRGWSVSDPAEVCEGSKGSVEEGGSGLHQILRPQFPNWGGHDSSIQGDGGLPHHDAGEVAEPGLCRLCEDPQGTVGQLYIHVVLTLWGERELGGYMHVVCSFGGL